MALAIKLDASKFIARNKAMMARADIAATAAILAYGDRWCDEVERIAPVSTGRYLRAWQQAMVQAGGRSRVLITIGPNKSRAKLIETYADLISRKEATLARALETKKNLEEWFYSHNPPRVPTNPKALAMVAFVKDIPKMQNALKKLIEGLAKFTDEPSSVIMGWFGGNILLPAKGRRVVYVRGLVGVKGAYGGEGSVVVEGGKARLKVRNREPHSRVVEWRRFVTANAGDAVKTQFITTSRRLVLRKLKGETNG